MGGTVPSKGEIQVQEADKFMIRLPNGWRDAIKARAARNRRSMNSEILAALEGVVGEAAGEGFADTAPAAEVKPPRVNAADIITNG